MSLRSDLAAGVAALMNKLAQPAQKQAPFERGFMVQCNRAPTTMSFSGLYTSFTLGHALCYSVVNEKGEVVGYDLRGSPTRVFSTSSLDKSDLREMVKKIPDGPVVTQIETSDPHGIVGEGYPDPSWKPGTICMIDKDKKLVYASTFPYSPLPDMIHCNSGIAFGSVLVDTFTKPTPVPAKKRAAPRSRSSSSRKKRRT